MTLQKEGIDPMLHGFQKPQSSLPQGQVTIAQHEFANRLYCWTRHVLLHGWVQWLQPDSVAPRDDEKTAFRTLIGNFYHTVMPFKLNMQAQLTSAP